MNDSENGNEGLDTLVAGTSHGRVGNRICLRRGRSV